MTVMDYNDHRKDSELGTATFDMKSLNEDPAQEDLTVPVLLAGKPRGILKLALRFFPVLAPKKLADGTEEPLPEFSKLFVPFHFIKYLNAMYTSNRDRCCAPYGPSRQRPRHSSNRLRV